MGRKRRTHRKYQSVLDVLSPIKLTMYNGIKQEMFTLLGYRKLSSFNHTTQRSP
jgi:hypothetical protein